MKRKLEIKVRDNEDAIMNGVWFGPIDYEWAFSVPNARYQEPAGRPISRISKQVNALGEVVEIQLGVG